MIVVLLLFSGARTQLAACPLFDAIVYQASISTPGLVFMKEGKGFTAPETWETEGDRPFPFWQGVGRCLNADCRSGPPPVGGIRDLGEGETWCDSSANFGGQVVQIRYANLNCEYQKHWTDTTNPCTEVGKAWGVCSRKNIGNTPACHLFCMLRTFDNLCSCILVTFENFLQLEDLGCRR